MTDSHTKGPWIVRDAPYGYDILVLDKATERALWIASVTTGIGKDSPFYPSRSECEANAALIASAPVLAAENIKLRADLEQASRAHSEGAGSAVD